MAKVPRLSGGKEGKYVGNAFFLNTHPGTSAARRAGARADSGTRAAGPGDARPVRAGRPTDRPARRAVVCMVGREEGWWGVEKTSLC